MDNIFAFIVLACQKALLEGKAPDEELGEDRLSIAKTLIGHNYDKDRITNFLIFLKNFLYINNPKINSKFDQEIIQLTGGTIDMSVIEIVKKQERQQGAQQKSYEFVENLIRQTDFDDAKIASLAVVSLGLVKKIRSDLKRRR